MKEADERRALLQFIARSESEYADLTGGGVDGYQQFSDVFDKVPDATIAAKRQEEEDGDESDFDDVFLNLRESK